MTGLARHPITLHGVHRRQDQGTGWAPRTNSMAAFDYTTVQEVKAYVDSQGTTDDSLLPDLVTGVSRAIDRSATRCSTRRPWSTTRARGRSSTGTASSSASRQRRSSPASPPRPTGSRRTRAGRLSTSARLTSRMRQRRDAALSQHRARRLPRPPRAAQTQRWFRGYASRDVMPDDLVWYARLAAAAEYAKRGCRRRRDRDARARRRGHRATGRRTSGAACRFSPAT